MPGAVRALHELGVALDGHLIRGIRYTDGAHSVDAPFRHGPGMGVRRTALHDALGEAVRAAGVEVIAQRAVEVAMDESRWGTRQHLALSPWTDLVEVHWAARSEAYVTPVGPDLVGVAVLSSAQAPFVEQLAAFPQLQARLAGAVPASSVRGAGPLRQRTSARVSGRALLVGDASGYVDALTGEGIAVALHCARALVDCVAADDPESYHRRWSGASRRYRALTSTLLWARRQPPLARQIVPMSARLPRIFGAAVQQLAG